MSQIEHGRSASADRREVADWIVVGSGAAGATVALLLAEAGEDVLVLEEGPAVTADRFTANMWRTMQRLFRDRGTQFMMGESIVPVLQGRVVGGTTVINSAICWRLPEKVHADWLARDPALAETIPYARLADGFEVIERDLQIQEVPPGARGQNNLLMQKGADALGYKGRVIRRNVAGCEGAALCLQGCPTGRKQSMALTYIPRTLAAGGRLWADCRVDRVDVAGGRATGVQASLLDDSGRRVYGLHAQARKGVVLGASALQSPALLQRSGLGRAGPVGDHFMCHPGAGVVGIYPQKVDMWTGATQGYEVDEFWDRRVKIEALALPPELLTLRMPGMGARLGRYLELADHMVLWGAQIRCWAEGRVRATRNGGVKIRWSPDARDMEGLRFGLRVTAELAFASGAERILLGAYGLAEEIPDMDTFDRELPKLRSPRQLNMIATHLFGTARMGSDPRDAVVDPRFECHAAKGLYVVDSSVFPTNLGVNPQHSIMGMARRAAELLLGG